MRLGRKVGIPFAALACMAVLALPVAAAETENDIEDALAVFSLKGTHGYSMLVIAAPEVDEAVPPEGQRRGAAFVFVHRGQSSAVYVTPATMTAAFVAGRPTITALQVDLEAVGKIALTFKSSGTRKAFRPSCATSPIAYAAGNYEGTIEFHGEEGFTDVSATAAAQRPQAFFNLLCAAAQVNEVTGPRQPGARLEVTSRLASGVELRVNQNRPQAPVLVHASIRERRGKIEIDRATTETAPGRAFSFERDLRRARLSLSSPFSGHASYRRDAKPAQRWTGNLNVDLPGRSNVPLAGPGVHATLVHATRRVVGHGPSADRVARALRLAPLSGP